MHTDSWESASETYYPAAGAESVVLHAKACLIVWYLYLWVCGYG